MKKIILLIISYSLITCNNDTEKNKTNQSIRILSFDQFINSASTEKKEMELFSGEKLKGSIVSLGMRSRSFSIYPDDELTIYGIKGTTIIDLEQGEYFIGAGQAAFLPRGIAYRLSSKNEKIESKVLIVQSNSGKMFALHPESGQ